MNHVLPSLVNKQIQIKIIWLYFFNIRMEVLISTEDAQCWRDNGHSQIQVGTQNGTGLLEGKLAVNISVSKVQSRTEMFYSTMHLIYDGSKPYNISMQQASPRL